jgi:hypothetical protein
VKEYQAIVWLANKSETPGLRVTVVAEDGDRAMAALKAEYGDDATETLWNEDDANRPR